MLFMPIEQLHSCGKAHQIPTSMAVEGQPSDYSSPRLSFSQDLILPGNPFSPQDNPSTSPNPDFDFNVSVEPASAQDPSPADELFSNGKILAIPIRNPNPKENADPVAGPASVKGAGKRSLWQFGRSASLNCASSGMIRKINFLRSYSAGSDPNPNSNPKPQTQAKPNPNPKPPRKRGAKKSQYLEGERRASPVQLLPKERGLIGFLLCNCVGGGTSAVAPSSGASAKVSDRVVHLFAIDLDGNKRPIIGLSGHTLLKSLTNSDLIDPASHRLEDIDACSGECEVHIAQEWLDKLPPPSYDEKYVLTRSSRNRILNKHSRLGCQVVLDKELEGMVVAIPEPKPWDIP